MRIYEDLALLTLRIGFGGIMLFSHGMSKLSGFSASSQAFPDPLGVGPALSMALAVFAEVFCSAFVMAGFLTRWASVPLCITMMVAAGLVHGADPWAKKEMAVLYLVAFLAILISGPGKLSLDSVLKKKKI